MFEWLPFPEGLEALFLLCHAFGYIAIIGSVSAMVVKLVRCRTQLPNEGALAAAERKITLFCCATFMLMGISIVVFFNSI